MSKEAKVIRGQVRQVVKEILPEILISELIVSIRRELQTEMLKRLSAIDDRAKDIQSYMVRQSAPVVPNPLGSKTE